MTRITANQLIDILLQKPERITSGILPKRSLWVQTQDSLFTCNRHKMETTGSGLGKLRQSLLLEFDEAVKVDQEHPRSLKKAMLELKALGYSNYQVKEIAGIELMNMIKKKQLKFTKHIDKNLTPAEQFYRLATI